MEEFCLESQVTAAFSAEMSITAAEILRNAGNRCEFSTKYGLRFCIFFRQSTVIVGKFQSKLLHVSENQQKMAILRKYKPFIF